MWRCGRVELRPWQAVFGAGTTLERGQGGLCTAWAEDLPTLPWGSVRASSGRCARVHTLSGVLVYRPKRNLFSDFGRFVIEHGLNRPTYA
jgi:hypothetical protein